MGRGRLKSGLQAFGAGRLRRIPSVTIEQTIPEPPNPPKPPSGNEDISNGGVIITPSKPGGPPDITDAVEITPTVGGKDTVGGGPLIIATMPFLGENGPIRPDETTVIEGGGGRPSGLRSLPASLPTRTPEIRNFPAPKTVVENPSTKGLSRGSLEFSGSITSDAPTIRVVPEFDPGARNQGRNDYIKENLLVYTIHASDLFGVTASGRTYENGVRKYLDLLSDLYSLDSEGKSREIQRDITPLGLSQDGFPVKARTLDNLAINSSGIHTGSSGANFFSQQFFRYDLTGNGGVTGMTTGDTITDASLILTINDHTVDRSSAPRYTGDSTTFVQGPSAVPPRVFQAIKVNATYDADFMWYLSGTSWGHTYGWSGFYGTGKGTDVDVNKKVEFTIDKPLKHGETIKLDLKTLATDALANASGIMRFAIRPKSDKNNYGITGYDSGNNGLHGVGLHLFGIDRELSKPELQIKFNPSNSSTKERLARLIRGK